MALITVHDRQFQPYITSDRVQKRVAEMAARMAEDHKNDIPLFVGVLNGAFRFASDLLAHYNGLAEISFVKLASYSGTESTGTVNALASLNTEVEGRRVVVLEDIVDTGKTIEFLIAELETRRPAQIQVASLLLKPDVYKGPHTIAYCGFEIPNLFVVGYGLDYNGLGRNLNDIYQIKPET